jgi:hypothetical protein
MKFGMLHCVSIYTEGNKKWTSDGILVSSIELLPLSNLVGKRVRLRNNIGVITKFLSDTPDEVNGKYVSFGQGVKGHYCSRNPIETMNSQVGVFWEYLDMSDDLPTPFWNSFKTLKLL